MTQGNSGEPAKRDSAAHVRKVLDLLLDFVGIKPALLVFASSLAVSVSEAVGIVLLFPFIQIVVDRSAYDKVMQLGGGWFAGFETNHNLGIAVLGAGLGVFYLVRGVIHTRLVAYQAFVAANLTVTAANTTISGALAARYQFFQKHPPAEVAGVSYSNATHAALLLQAGVGTLNEVIFFGLIAIGLIVINPLLIIAATAAVLLFGVLLVKPFARRATSMGRLVREVDDARHRFVFAMASATRDIKIMALEQSFIDRNKSIAAEHAGLNASYASMTVTMRIMIETIMLLAVAGICTWIGASGASLVDLAPMLGTLAIVVARAVPSLSRLLVNYNAMRFSWPFVERLSQTIDEIARYPQARIADQLQFPAEYHASNLSFRYGEVHAVNDVSIRIPPCSVVVIYGPSGSGKSTLLDLLTGLQPPSEGSFYLNQAPFQPFSSRDFPRHVGYVPQTIAIFDGSLEFNIALENDPDPRRIEAAIARAHLTQVVAGMKDGLKTRLGSGGQGVSGGQQQRIGIARALYREPALLVLDEVTSALDAQSKAGVVADLLALRATTSLLFVTHDLSHLDTADRLYRMEGGRLMLEKGAADE